MVSFNNCRKIFFYKGAAFLPTHKGGFAVAEYSEWGFLPPNTMKILTTVEELQIRGLWDDAFKLLKEEYGKSSSEKSIDTSKKPYRVVLTEEQGRKLGLIPKFVPKNSNSETEPPHPW